jgi:hypothetical protein
MICGVKCSWLSRFLNDSHECQVVYDPLQKTKNLNSEDLR